MSAEFDSIKTAFKEVMAFAGVNIRIGPLTKKCVAGAIESERSQEVIAMLPKSATKVDMLVEDFDALGIVANSSNVFIATDEDEETEFSVLTIERDPMDPCVSFLVALAR
jgi:hypothetical protein